MAKRMTTAQVQALVKGLDDRTLAHLSAEANAENHRRFDARCPQGSPMNTAISLRQCWGIEPGQFTPPLNFAQTMPSTRVLGKCCVCLRPLLLFYPRDDGFLRVNGETVLVHWECAEAVRIAKAEPVQTAPVRLAKSPEQLDREGRYRADLWSFHVRTLYTILNEYRDAETSDPAAITADMRWQIECVRDVYNARAEDPALFEPQPKDRP